jgi:N-acetylmuramoyl-L-alanine amidase
MKHILAQRKSGITVVIDAGHGGFDPGKVGINKALEKDINLSIALKLKNYLEENNIKVIMTREDGKGLYQASDKDKKRVDMSKRVSIINSSNPNIAISIHQNSYSQESIKGAQVFYHANSEEGKILAEILQERIKKTINDGNHRLAKSNSSYYLLRHTECPLVIVECGFLSNRKEANLLIDEQYQDKMAQAICLGVLEYFDTSELYSGMGIQTN